MSHPRFSFLLLSLLALLGLAHSSWDTLQGDLNLTVIDSYEKNAGAVDASEDASEGYLHLGPPGNRKGAHLASAAAYLRKVNATYADEIMSNAGVPAPNAKDSKTLDYAGVTALWGGLGQQISYYGGPILSNPKGKIYVIFYGSWPSSSKQPILDFLGALNVKNPKGKGTPSVRDWWEINTKNYYNKDKKYVTGDVSVDGVVSLGYPFSPKGTRSRPFLRSDMRSIVLRALSKGIKFDPNALYLVLTSKDVYVDSFCSSTCSYHSHFSYKGKNLAYAFAGDSTSQCQLYCTYQYMDMSSSTYNGVGIDGMISMIAHELAGMTTNMFQGKNSPAGWVVADSQVENADLCSWLFGENLQWIPKGGKIFTYNLVGPNSRKYIVQTNYNRKTGTCEMKYRAK